MSEETAIMTLEEKQLAELAGMVAAEDSSKVVIPTLKINYDDESTFPKGTWVVGQVKNREGVIVEQGQEVKSLIILTVRNRWSYYSQLDTTKNCTSPLHVQGESVRGSKYGHICGNSCPLRAEDANPRCKAQKVVLGVAITADGQAVDCVAYLAGTNYKPFLDYFRDLTKVRAKAGYVDVPPFTFVTNLLPPKKEKNGSTTYFVAQFERGAMLSMEQIKGFAERREASVAYIERANAALGARIPSAPEVGHEPASRPSASGTGGDDMFHGDDLPSFDPVPPVMPVTPVPPKAAAAAPPSAPPWETAKAVTSEDAADFDIEAAIKAALGGK